MYSINKDPHVQGRESSRLKKYSQVKILYIFDVKKGSFFHGKNKNKYLVRVL